MVSYQYTYLLILLWLLIIWSIIFFWRRDTRKEMLVISLIFGILGPLAAYVYIQDWWKPLTITKTPVGIEDFLFSFLVGGIASVIYSFLFNKRIRTTKVKKLRERKKNLNFIFILSLAIVLFFGSFFILKLNSFISTILASVIPISIIYMKRRDLIKDSLLSGISTLVIAIIIYSILNLITPGFFDEFWLFQNIGRIIILDIPLEEYIFYFVTGAGLGPLYEYWKEGKLINVKR